MLLSLEVSIGIDSSKKKEWTVEKELKKFQKVSINILRLIYLDQCKLPRPLPLKGYTNNMSINNF
jgi:hypothetical protein